MKLILFLNSFAGRALKFGVGVLLIWIGYKMNTTTGQIVALFGVIPILTSMLDLCLIAPLFGYPIRGKKIRAQV